MLRAMRTGPGFVINPARALARLQQGGPTAEVANETGEGVSLEVVVSLALLA